MRDLETIQAALTIAETGHLVFGTLHTNSAPSTISRIIDVFPGDQQGTIQTKLSGVLVAVMCQQLLPLKTGGGRVLAFELMIPNTAIRSLIRESKLHMIHQTMQMGTEKSQMQTLNQHLFQLTTSGKISLEVAMSSTSDPDELTTMLQKGGAGGRRL
jgi:twitching motility protein PilT